MTVDLSVIVPAFNESKTIGIVVNKLVENLQQFTFEIVVVNDASHDNTAQVVSELMQQFPNVRLIQHQVNQGKTKALQTGIAESLGKVVIVQDADLEYDPADLPRVITPILNGTADVVYGSRLLDRNNEKRFMTKSLFANKVLTCFSNLFTRYKFTDIETCYKAFSSEIIKNMIISSKRFGFEAEVTAKISKLTIRVIEVPISYSGRTYEEGKKIGFKDGLQAFMYILKYNVFCSKQNSFLQEPKLR